MRIATEKEAGKFLSKEGFKLVEGIFINDKDKLDKFNFNYTFAAKSSGKNIVHKKHIGGVILNIKSLRVAKNSFDKLKKIKGSHEVLFQRQLSGKEFLLGIKKTKDFGHVVIYGAGGSGVENKEDFSFRVYPFKAKDAKEMIEETHIGRSLKSNEKKLIAKEIMRVSRLIKKFPKIKELDINPMMIGKVKGIISHINKAYVIDSRIVFG